uniref:Transposase_23 domain-containing protein n=1 Tax=Panagrellus redivivus TaxID=6233 RepID=A0A7E4W5W8_PANRE
MAAWFHASQKWATSFGFAAARVGGSLAGSFLAIGGPSVVTSSIEQPADQKRPKIMRDGRGRPLPKIDVVGRGVNACKDHYWLALDVGDGCLVPWPLVSPAAMAGL